MSYLLPLIIPVLSYFFQIYPRFFNRLFGVDVWSRMIEANLIRKNNHRVPKELIGDRFLLEGYFVYPPALPWLMSYFSKETILKYQGFIAPLFDSLQNILVFLITLQLSGDFNLALLSQVIYATIPLAALENSYLTPRSMGYLNFTLAFYPLILFYINPNPIYLLTGIFFTTLCFFVHKFASQSLLFISIFLCLIDKTPFYLMVFLVSMLLAIIFSKGFYLQILKGHYANIYFWTKNYQYRFSHQVRGLKKQARKMDFISLVYLFLNMAAPIALIASNAWLVLPMFYLVNAVFGFNIIPNTDPLLFKLALWVVFCYLFSLIVMSVKKLTPIGEGQRYLEMAFAPTAILSALIFSTLLNTSYRSQTIILYVLIIITNLAITIFSQWKAIIADKNRSVTKGMDQVFTFIDKLSPTPKILCIPHQITTMLLFNTKKAKILVEIEAGHLLRIPDVFPIIKKSIPELAKKYDLNLLVLKKDYATMEELNLNKKDLLFESNDTQIFRINKD